MNFYNNKRGALPAVYASLCIFLLGIACNKESDPATSVPPEISLNFYNASEALLTSHVYQQKYVFVDHYDTATTFHPYFYSGIVDQYPGITGLTPGVISFITYMRLAAGEHRFIFSNADKIMLADTSMMLQSGAYHQQYIADALPAADSTSQYKIVDVQDERIRLNDKVKVRILNLSADIGALNVYRLLADGRRIFDGMPGSIRFGDATPYIALDTLHTARQQLTLQFFPGTDTLTPVLSATIPAVPGSSYVLLIQGYKTGKRIKSPVGLEGGAMHYEMLDIPANLRAVVRQSY